jgi:hypothetical protein
MARTPRRQARPQLEGLEDRQLMTGGHVRPINDTDLRRFQVQKVNFGNGSFAPDRRMMFATPSGGRAIVSLFGVGTLKGTTIDPQTGGLIIQYNGTNSNSRIIGQVKGGDGTMPLLAIKDADVAIASLSGAGANQLDVVNLRPFRLIDGGKINLIAGVGTLSLKSMGANTTINLTSLPIPSGATNPSPSSPGLGATFVSGPNGLELAGVGGITLPGAIGSPSPVTPGGAGSGFTTRIEPNGQVVLIPTTTPATTTAQVQVGTNIFIESVNAQPRPLPVGPALIYGYDSVANALVRFDTTTGAPLATTPLSVPGSPRGEVGLARMNGALVALVGVNTTVEVFDALTAQSLGTFSTANIFNGQAIDGVGQSDRNALLVSSAAQQTQIIDVGKSLAAGQVVAALDNNGNPVGPYTPRREFTLAGGASGAAGLSTEFLPGSGFFDTATPNQTQPGMLTVSTTNDVTTETARVALASVSKTGPNAIGSVDLFAALVTGFDATEGKNTVTLYNPSGFSRAGSLTLNYPARLSGLSESYRPDLEGAAIINAGGTVNQFVSHTVTGLAFNTIGFLNLINVDRAIDTTFIGQPIGHVDIDRRDNVRLISSANRSVDSRGGVTIVPDLRVVGPLELPGRRRV